MRISSKPTLVMGCLTFLLFLGCEIPGSVDFDDSSMEERVASTGHKANNLLPGARLNRGNYLESTNGSYRLSLQTDGNLVLRRMSDKKALWASGTNGKSATSFSFQSDGNLVLKKSTGTVVWKSKTNGSGATKLYLHSAGSLVLYKGSTAVWSVNGSSPPSGDDSSPPSGDDTSPPSGDNSSVPSGKEMKIVILSVGSADSSLVFFPTGRIMLIDSATQAKFASTVLPFLQQHGIKHVDYYVETHPHPDHIGGRDSLIAKGIVNSKTVRWDWETHDYEDQFTLEGTKWFIMNVRDKDFHGSDANDNSLSYRIDYNGFIYSGAADEGTRAQERMLKDHASLVQAHVRNTAHHMWGPVSQSFVVKTNPYLFVTSCYSRSTNDLPSNFRNAVTTLKKSGRLKESVITGDVGHVVIRASSASKWSYEFCGSNKLCSSVKYLP